MCAMQEPVLYKQINITIFPCESSALLVYASIASSFAKQRLNFGSK